MKNSTYTAEAELPVVLNFDSNIVFAPGTAIPARDAVLRLMEGADYESYIMNYVWMSDPEGTIFFEVQQAVFTALAEPASEEVVP